MISCSCSGDFESRRIYSCAGAANTGFLADQVARILNRDKIGDRTCLAAVGSDFSGFIESARGTTRNIVIEGCPVGCGKKTFEARGLPFEHSVTTSFDVVKGKTPITSDVIERVTESIKGKIEECSPTH